MDHRKDDFKNIYISGYIAESPRFGDEYMLGEYQLSRMAAEEFEARYLELEEYVREEVRDEEMEIARRDLVDLERHLYDLEKELEEVAASERKKAVQQLSNLLKTLPIEETVSENGEEWAYNDGWNAAVARVSEAFAEFINRK